MHCDNKDEPCVMMNIALIHKITVNVMTLLNHIKPLLAINTPMFPPSITVKGWRLASARQGSECCMADILFIIHFSYGSYSLYLNLILF